MDFSWPEEYIDYRQEVIEFAKTHLSDDLIKRDLEGTFSKAHWNKCGEFGLLGLSALPKYGGTYKEIDVLRSTFAMQGFGYACRDVGLGIAINAHLWAVQSTISFFGTEDQKAKYLPKMTSGEWIGAHALTEKNSGSDVFSMESTATKVDGGYILNGEKRLVTLAPIADVAIVFANSNPELGKWGISTFIVDKSMKGFLPLEVQSKMGLRTVPIGKIKLENCFVPEENLVGKEGSGLSISNHSLEYDRCSILAAKLGAMERQLEDAVSFAKERNQFGQAIGNFQAVSHRIADMKSRLEISKLLLYKMAWLKKNGKSGMLDGAILKLFLSESYVQSSLDAIRIHGGSGYLTEHEIERDLRDSIGGIIYAGTSDIQKNIISKFLGL